MATRIFLYPMVQAALRCGAVVWGFGVSVVAAAPVCVTDDVNQTVCVSQVKRVVSLAPHLTELLFFVGAGDSVVAVDRSSNFPPQVRALPSAGDAQRVDMERIASLKPDLVVAWASGSPPATYAQLRKLGIPVFVSEPLSVQAVASSMVRLGALTGHATQAKAKADAWLAEWSALQQQHQRTQPVRVFYQVWHQPLMTLNASHVVSDTITRCGGVTGFANTKALAPQVSMEAVLQFNPQLVLASGDSGRLEHWAAWPQVSAVSNKQLYSVSAETLVRPGPRLLDAARQVCAKMSKVPQP